MPISRPYGETSVADQLPPGPAARLPVDLEAAAAQRVEGGLALPALSEPAPDSSPYALGCSGCGDQYSRLRIASSARSSVGRCLSISWAAESAVLPA